ncbi:GDSL-type esterase/lipase family protein [Cryptosporangium aurantiacum]|uniref:Lysophospholipase L1 n=1 Tax=Cryptosporangium aurantiacum TaxID=134849 RepID=A0A1M7RGM0_9ACTN|nr:GDSL-type esterase/lipase family protein [Cryptosporangium aurantiacum]SHN45380.1 Lysophospholipase L1 [Cryptosporangium aurantiacum]
MRAGLSRRRFRLPDVRRWRRRRVIALIVVVALVGGVTTTLLVRALREEPPQPSEPAARRYGFTTDGGAPWAPESGRLSMARSGGSQRIEIGFRFRTEDEIRRLDGHGLELRLTVRTVGPCGSATGWSATPANGGAAPSVRGLPKDAEPYVAVTEGQTCTETLVRIGSLKPEHLTAGHEYTVTARVPAGRATPIGATLTVARRALADCAGDSDADRADCLRGTVASSGPDVEELVSADRGWAFDGSGCRRWFSEATTSFPCLPDDGARIMTLGDSITSGAIGDHTWRYWAWQKLEPASHPEWVGTKTETWTGDYAVPHEDWGSRHDSQAGVTADTVEGRVPSLMRLERPDLVLINLGTNDTHPLHGSSAADAAASLDRIVASAQAADPNVQILLGQPDGHQDVPVSVMAELAIRLAGVASARTTSDSLVSIVDLRTGWDRDVHTFDGTHPTQAGEYLIASRFVNRLANTFGFGRVYGAIPRPPAPPTPKNVKSLAQDGGLLLAWDRVPQVSEYRVYLRDDTRGGKFERVGSGSREVQWGRSGMAVGHQYSYYVTAVSSGRESKPSPIGRVRAT